MVVCPFHDDVNPSLSIDLVEGTFVCFACGATGTLVDLVERLSGGDRMDAIRLIHGARSEFVDDLAESELSPRRRRTTYNSFEARWAWFHKVDWDTIADTHPVAKYLIHKRGLKRSTLSVFDARMTESMDYPVVFPIVMDKKMVGFVKRRIDAQTESKYLYNDGFDARSSMAYYATDHSPLLVVEGILDLMKAAQFGAKNCCALLGWKLSEEKAMWLQARGHREVVSGLDNTETGQQGHEALVASFPTVYRFEFPPGAKDVGDMSINSFWRGWPI